MDLELPGKDEGGTEDQETFVVDEVLFVHQHKCGGSDQSDCGRTQTRKGGNDIFVVLELGKNVGETSTSMNDGKHTANVVRQEPRTAINGEYPALCMAV